MNIKVLTLFPQMVEMPMQLSIVGRAQKNGVVNIEIHDLRKWSTDNYKTVDDRPYGGGPGMILKVDVIDRAVREISNKVNLSRVVLLDAGGKKFDQTKAIELSRLDELTLICGHYEGVDHRVHEHVADEVLSIGNYVLSGGELAAMVVIDAITRLKPGSLGNVDSLVEESHNQDGVSEYPQYTRPEIYNGWKVPTVLTSGNHKKIEEWKSYFSINGNLDTS